MKFGVAVLMILVGSNAFADRHESFRTPVKMLGAAYTVKLSLKRDLVEYEVPVWIKPDQAHSTLDRAQLKDLGWIFNNMRPDDVSLSGESLDFKEFKDAKSDWAYPPEYPKTCCYGVLGNDILKQFRLEFDPQPPAHIVWNRLMHFEENLTSRFVNGLKTIFNFHEEIIRYDGKKINLADTPFELELGKGELKFLTPRVIVPKTKLKIVKEPILRLRFLPPDRDLQIEGVAPSVAVKARDIGIRKGMRITDLNYIHSSYYDRFEVEKMFTGQQDARIEFTLEISPRDFNKDGVRKPIIYDFVNERFEEEHPPAKR